MVVPYGHMYGFNTHNHGLVSCVFEILQNNLNIASSVQRLTIHSRIAYESSQREILSTYGPADCMSQKIPKLHVKEAAASSATILTVFM